MKKSELKALILECKQELAEEGAFQNNPNLSVEDAKPVFNALADAFKNLAQFVADHDLEDDIASEYPFELSLDDMNAEVQDWVKFILK